MGTYVRNEIVDPASRTDVFRLPDGTVQITYSSTEIVYTHVATGLKIHYFGTGLTAAGAGTVTSVSSTNVDGSQIYGSITNFSVPWASIQSSENPFPLYFQTPPSTFTGYSGVDSLQSYYPAGTGVGD